MHRDFAQVAIWQAGVVREAGRFATTPPGVRAFAAELGPADGVALEATGNTARHGTQVAIVATARKLAVLCWHLPIKGESYAFTQPSLLANKHRRLELRAGQPPGNGRKGNAAGYSLKAVRDAERGLAAQGEAGTGTPPERTTTPTSR